MMSDLFIFWNYLKSLNFVFYTDTTAPSQTNITFLVISLIFLFGFVSLLLLISFLLSPKLRDVEKNSPYECGFNPFEDTRSVFEIQFYRVAILFIIFDLEIAFLLPWVIVYKISGSIGFWLISVFLFLLTLGFIYELMSGALDWE